MKAEELMIGDWVLYKGKPIKIIGIDGSQNIIYYYNEEDYTEYPIDASNVEPISLTKEILEKNGFEKSQGEKFTWFICNVAAFVIRIVSEKNNLYDIKISEYPRPIKYVHTLQHALKLCEIEEEIIL